MNTVVLSGRFSATPELHTTPEGVKVTNFQLAVDRSYDHNLVDWISCVSWRKTAEFVCQYFEKGDPIEVLGTLQTRSYTDKNENKHTATEVVVEKVCFAKSSKKKNEGREASTVPFLTENDASTAVREPDELPSFADFVAVSLEAELFGES